MWEFVDVWLCLLKIVAECIRIVRSRMADCLLLRVWGADAVAAFMYYRNAVVVSCCRGIGGSQVKEEDPTQNMGCEYVINHSAVHACAVRFLRVGKMFSDRNRVAVAFCAALLMVIGCDHSRGRFPGRSWMRAFPILSSRPGRSASSFRHSHKVRTRLYRIG